MSLQISEILPEIDCNLSSLGITLYPQATELEIFDFEQAISVKIPEELRRLYTYSNGFISEEDLFRIIPLDEILKWRDIERSQERVDFVIAEYMIYCDSWWVKIDRTNPNTYLIYQVDHPDNPLTNSIAEFLAVFMTGGVFGSEGLYEWAEQQD